MSKKGDLNWWFIAVMILLLIFLFVALVFFGNVRDFLAGFEF